MKWFILTALGKGISARNRDLDFALNFNYVIVCGLRLKPYKL